MVNQIEKMTVTNLLRPVKRGIGIDAAKKHTGIALWEEGELYVDGFKLKDIDEDDPHWELRIRLEFKDRLRPYVEGKHFDYIIMEDVYFGDNPSTVRKLLAINTVIDELIFDGVCSVDKFQRSLAVSWMKDFRKVHKQEGYLKSKYETQGILEYMDFDFIKENKSKTEVEKTKIYYEDICDATAMLCATVIRDKMKLTEKEKNKEVRKKDLKYHYVEKEEDIKKIRNPRVRKIQKTNIDYRGKNIEAYMLSEIKRDRNNLYCMRVSTRELGLLGVKLNFYDQGYGYMYFYHKDIGKVEV